MKWEKISANNIFGKGCISVKAWAAATVQKHSWEELPHVRGRGSGWECQAAMVQEQPKGATPRPRPGAVARRSYPTSKVRGGGREELPCLRGQGRYPRVPGCNSTGAAKRRYLTPKVRGSGREEQPHIQRAEAALGQEGLEELRHVHGQEGRRWGDTPRPR